MGVLRTSGPQAGAEYGKGVACGQALAYGAGTGSTGRGRPARERYSATDRLGRMQQPRAWTRNAACCT